MSKTDNDKQPPKNKWEKVVPQEEQEGEPMLSEGEETGESGVPEYDYDELLMLYKEAKSKSEQHWDQFVRSEAEFKNFQTRVEKRITDTHKFAAEKILNELLPVMDSLEQGLDHAPKDEAEAVDAMRQGMTLTLKMLNDVLAKFGVVQINPLNQPYDPHLHEALSMQEVEGYTAGTVTFVVQKGYSLHGRVIRPARVMVAK